MRTRGRKELRQQKQETVPIKKETKVEAAVKTVKRKVKNVKKD